MKKMLRGFDLLWPCMVRLADGKDDSAKAYEALLIRLRAQGLNTDKLEMTLQ